MFPLLREAIVLGRVGEPQAVERRVPRHLYGRWLDFLLLGGSSLIIFPLLWALPVDRAAGCAHLGASQCAEDCAVAPATAGLDADATKVCNEPITAPINATWLRYTAGRALMPGILSASALFGSRTPLALLYLPYPIGVLS